MRRICAFKSLTGSSGRPFEDLAVQRTRKFYMRALIIAGVMVLTSTAAALAQDAAAGEKVFAVCRACNQIGETAKNAVGPVLNGVVGRKAGTYPGYSYSDANKNSGITWTEANLAAYLPAPMKFIPGTKMTFVGLPMPQDVADVIAYLKTFDSQGNKVGPYLCQEDRPI